MKYYHKKRLLKLADFLEKVPNENFDFDIIIEGEIPKQGDCGTVGCAMGWAPFVFPRLLEYEKNYWDKSQTSRIKFKGEEIATAMLEIAQELFGITNDEAWALFEPGGHLHRQGLGLNELSNPTAKEVAANIRLFVKNEALHNNNS